MDFPKHAHQSEILLARLQKAQRSNCLRQIAAGRTGLTQLAEPGLSDFSQ